MNSQQLHNSELQTPREKEAFTIVRAAGKGKAWRRLCRYAGEPSESFCVGVLGRAGATVRESTEASDPALDEDIRASTATSRRKLKPQGVQEPGPNAGPLPG